jgi:hypothetical protein
MPLSNKTEMAKDVETKLVESWDQENSQYRWINQLQETVRLY